MSTKRSIRIAVASTAAALTLGLTAVGIAAAAPPTLATRSFSAASVALSVPSTTPATPGQMEQLMRKMLSTLPPQQRTEMQKMHDQMPTAMKTMMAGNKMMPENKTQSGHTAQTPTVMSNTDAMMGG